MATSYSSTIKVYSGVPLVKGGTEVLYLSQGAAEGVLGAFLKATYSNYYFVRENRQAVQIDAPFGDLDDVNYISFTNASHGGKIFFGFVDRVVYINDNCTQIEFTIDPFPTYLGDTKELETVFVVRNTLVNDVRGSNLQDDYLPQSAANQYVELANFNLVCNQGRVLFAGKTGLGEPLLDPRGGVTGIQYGTLSPTVLQSILDDGGTIIGAYLEPPDLPRNMVVAAGTLSGNPLAHMTGYTWEKLRTGVYTQVALATSQSFKAFELEEFSNPQNVEFQIVYFRVPAFSVFIYPKNYRGVADNTAEGVYMQAPALSISARQGYTNQQMSSDIFNTLASTIAGAVGGAAKGGGYGAAIGAVAGFVGGTANMAKNAYMSKFKAPQTTGGSVPITAADLALKAQLLAVSPRRADCNRIDKYFDYFGYAINAEKSVGGLGSSINLRDGAYLQTGSEMLVGSEVDDELNARLMSGIKIRKTLS